MKRKLYNDRESFDEVIRTKRSIDEKQSCSSPNGWSCQKENKWCPWEGGYWIVAVRNHELPPSFTQFGAIFSCSEALQHICLHSQLSPISSSMPVEWKMENTTLYHNISKSVLFQFTLSSAGFIIVWSNRVILNKKESKYETTRNNKSNIEITVRK